MRGMRFDGQDGAASSPPPSPPGGQLPPYAYGDGTGLEPPPAPAALDTGLLVGYGEQTRIADALERIAASLERVVAHLGTGTLTD